MTFRTYVIGYLVLAAGIVLGLWGNYRENQRLERHLNSHETVDVKRTYELTQRICFEQNRVKLLIQLRPLTICDPRSSAYLQGP